MLQEYKNLLIHISTFEEEYNHSTKNGARLQEMYYRDILDYLYPKHNLFLLGAKDINAETIASNIGIISYFEKIYTASSEKFTEQDFRLITRNMCWLDSMSSLVIGKNKSNEITEANIYSIPTCMIMNNNSDISLIGTTYEIDSFQKIKTIL